MRFHVVNSPNTQTTRGYDLCGFTVQTINFCRMLKELCHTVYLYSSEDNEAKCDEHICCITKGQQRQLFGDAPYNLGSFDPASPQWVVFNAMAAHGIGKRAQEHDIICVNGGRAHEPIAKALPKMMTVEYGIGYIGTFAEYQVFESNAWRHYLHGKFGHENGRFYDAVIPHFFAPEEFPFSAEKDDYVLYVGRLVAAKGLKIACQAAARAGVKLKVAGWGDKSLVTDGAEYVGTPSLEERNRLMSRARAVLMPTQYMEPFGSVAVEAMMCGTPAITTEFGAFTETIEHGVTGFRCTMLRDFVEAIAASPKLDPAKIRERAVAQFSIAAAKPRYEAYFQRLQTLWGGGWEA